MREDRHNSHNEQRHHSHPVGSNKPLQPGVVALSGIFLALTVIALYLESIAPTGRLSLYALSSLFASVIVIEAGIKAGWLFYIASSLLAFLIVPDKTGLIPYYAFFGLFSLVKYYAEKQSSLVFEFMIKYIFFNLCLALAYFLLKELFAEQAELKLPWWVLLAALEIAFFVYDYLYSLFIQLYRNRLRRMIGLR